MSGWGSPDLWGPIIDKVTGKILGGGGGDSTKVVYVPAEQNPPAGTTGPGLGGFMRGTGGKVALAGAAGYAVYRYKRGRNKMLWAAGAAVVGWLAHGYIVRAA